MNWCERHLNWTLVLACLAVTAVTLAVDILHPLYGVSYEAQRGMVFAAGYWLPLGPCAWALRKKSQSLWWLPAIWVSFFWWTYLMLLPLMPFVGWVVTLGLENRSGEKPAGQPGLGGRCGMAASDAPLDNEAGAAAPGRGPRVCRVIDLAAMMPLLVMAGCAAMRPGVAYAVSGLATAALALALMLVPDRVYAGGPAIRLVAVLLSVVLGVAGVLGLLLGCFLWLGDEADPGHVGKMPAYCAWAAAAVVSGCSAVLAVRLWRVSRKAGKAACAALPA